jgi:hypothetical protein
VNGVARKQIAGKGRKKTGLVLARKTPAAVTEKKKKSPVDFNAHAGSESVAEDVPLFHNPHRRKGLEDEEITGGETLLVAVQGKQSIRVLNDQKPIVSRSRAACRRQRRREQRCQQPRPSPGTSHYFFSLHFLIVESCDATP